MICKDHAGKMLNLFFTNLYEMVHYILNSDKVNYADIRLGNDNNNKLFHWQISYFKIVSQLSSIWMSSNCFRCDLVC